MLFAVPLYLVRAGRRIAGTALTQVRLSTRDPHRTPDTVQGLAHASSAVGRGRDGAGVRPLTRGARRCRRQVCPSSPPSAHNHASGLRGGDGRGLSPQRRPSSARGPAGSAPGAGGPVPPRRTTPVGRAAAAATRGTPRDRLRACARWREREPGGEPPGGFEAASEQPVLTPEGHWPHLAFHDGVVDRQAPVLQEPFEGLALVGDVGLRLPERARRSSSSSDLGLPLPEQVRRPALGASPPPPRRTDAR
jgi:hypothetical protein